MEMLPRAVIGAAAVGGLAAAAWFLATALIVARGYVSPGPNRAEQKQSSRALVDAVSKWFPHLSAANPLPWHSALVAPLSVPDRLMRAVALWLVQAHEEAPPHALQALSVAIDAYRMNHPMTAELLVIQAFTGHYLGARGGVLPVDRKQQLLFQALAHHTCDDIAFLLLARTFTSDTSAISWMGQTYTKQQCCLSALAVSPDLGPAWRELALTMPDGNEDKVVDVGGRRLTKTQCVANAARVTTR